MEETAINSCLSLCSVFHTFFVPCLLCDTLKARARRSIIIILEILLYLKDLKTSRNSRNVSSLPWVIDPLPGYLSFPLSSVSRLLKSTFIIQYLNLSQKKKPWAYFWKGKSLVAARSKEGETVTADFLPNLGELQGLLGALPDPASLLALDPKLS